MCAFGAGVYFANTCITLSRRADRNPLQLFGPRGPEQVQDGQSPIRGSQILDCRGFDSSRILILRGGLLMSIGNFQEVLSQRILAGILLVGRSGARSVREPKGRAEFRRPRLVAVSRPIQAAGRPRAVEASPALSRRPAPDHDVTRS